MRHELFAGLALVSEQAAPGWHFVMWERSIDGEVTRRHSEHLAQPAGPGRVNAMAFPIEATGIVAEWLLARLALEAATEAAHDG